MRNQLFDQIARAQHVSVSTLSPRALAGLRLASDLLFLRYAIFGVAEWRLGKGIEMDSTALNELIAQVRGTAATLAEAEQRVAAFTAELAQQKLPDASPALLRATPMPKRASFGSQSYTRLFWVPDQRRRPSQKSSARNRSRVAHALQY